jgi:hypothetical protein
VLVVSLVALLAGCSDQHETTVNPPAPNPDTQPPMTPSMGQWTAKEGGPLYLAWSEGSEADLAGYNIYRYAPNPGSLQSYVKLNMGLVTENSLMVQDAMPGVYEHYRVSSVDDSGNESAMSSAVETSFHFGSEDQPPPIEPNYIP